MSAKSINLSSTKSVAADSQRKFLLCVHAPFRRRLHINAWSASVDGQTTDDGVIHFELILFNNSVSSGAFDNSVNIHKSYFLQAGENDSVPSMGAGYTGAPPPFPPTVQGGWPNLHNVIDIANVNAKSQRSILLPDGYELIVPDDHHACITAFNSSTNARNCTTTMRFSD